MKNHYARREHYFAYGSNLDLEQMRRRCPSARALRVAILRGYRLGFAGRSALWSGGGVATLWPASDEWVKGVLYELAEAELARLDRFEGHPVAYCREQRLVEDEFGMVHSAQIYLKRGARKSKPSKAYLEVITEAYHRLGFDDSPLLKVSGGLR